MSVKVTILLTSYNHADFLKQSIDSILNQTFKNFELIIIDDCSTDDSWNIIKKYRDKRIKKIRNKVNKGSIMNKELIESFNGKYFAIAHCDDCWEKDKLEKQVNFLDNHSEYAACFTYVKLIDESNNEVENSHYVNFNLDNRNRFEWLNYFFYNGNCLCHPSILIRKNVQLKEELFVNGLKSLPDFYRWVKLCLNNEIYIYPEKLSMFRVRNNALNTSGFNYNNILRVSFEELKVLDLYLKLNENDFIKVFPNAIRYNNGKGINKKFAFARLCIDVGRNNYIYYGLNLIYDLLQDKKTRIELEKEYNYSKKDFMEETGEHDMFNILDNDRIKHSTLYFKYDTDYVEDNSLKLNYVIKDKNYLELFFACNDKRVKEIRFDPDENNYYCFYNIEIYVNEYKVDNYYTNCTFMKNDKYYFYHYDPSIFIPFDGIVHDVVIKANFKKITIDEIINFKASELANNMIEQQKMKNKFKKIINSLFNK